MNVYNLARNKVAEFNRRQTNVLQCLAEDRDAKITFRLPLWMKRQIEASGKSYADFIIAKLAEDTYKPTEIDKEAWEKEVNEY